MRKLVTAVAGVFLALSASVAAEGDIRLTYNGALLESEQPPVISNGRTLVPVRTVCEAMGLDVVWDGETRTVRICDELNLVTLVIGSNEIDVNDEKVYIEAAPEIINDTTCVPIRAVVEPFGAEVGWDSRSRTVSVTNEYLSGAKPAVDGDLPETNSEPEQELLTEPAKEEVRYPFYYQSQPDWGFESNGRGYCWVCSYAMILTKLTQNTITPVDVAAYNLENGGTTGSYMTGHHGITDRFGAKLVPALDEDSMYFESYDSSHRGATYIKAETDDEVRGALCEALVRNPDGIMVRFEGYPHTMVAVGYADGVVYFNDPAQENMENVPFSDTCLGKKYKLTDLSYIQAVSLK